MRLLMLSLLVGCTRPGPDPALEEEVMAATWDGHMGMEVGSRPSIEWLPADCHDNSCRLYSLKDDGRARVNWYGSFYDSLGFIFALVDWKSFLMTGFWFPDDELDQVYELSKFLKERDY